MFENKIFDKSYNFTSSTPNDAIWYFLFFSLDDSSKKSLLSHLFSDLKGSSYIILSAVTAVFCFKGQYNGYE